MLKLVLDTNTLVSAFFWKGNESKLFEHIEQKKALLYTSPEILQEIEDVLHREKFLKVLSLTQQTPEQIIQKIISLSHIVLGNKQNIHICRDPKDDKFIVCAVLATADYLVSGDKDLLVLKQYDTIKIIPTSEILTLLSQH